MERARACYRIARWPVAYGPASIEPGASCSARRRQSWPARNGEIGSSLPDKYLNGYANEKDIVILMRYAT